VAFPTGAVSLVLGAPAPGGDVAPPELVFIRRIVITMRTSVIAGTSLALALLVCGANGEDALKSGPQVGDHMPIFEPLCMSGSRAGQKFCPV
jgi:hypothetical protein